MLRGATSQARIGFGVSCPTTSGGPIPCHVRQGRHDEAGSHAAAREERGKWSGRVHGPNGRRAWIRVADLRTAKDGEWAVTSGCQFRHCPAGHDSAVQPDVNAEPRVSGVWSRHNAGRGCWVVVGRFEDRPCTAVAVTSIPLRPLKLTEVVDSLGLPKLRRSSMTERELERRAQRRLAAAPR